MHCDQTEQRLNALLDNGLCVSSDELLTDHLIECPCCAQLADSFVAIESFGAMTAGPSVDVAAKVLATIAPQRIVQTSPQGVQITLRWLPHWATAAAVLVVATIASLYEPDGSNPIESQPGSKPPPLVAGDSSRALGSAAISLAPFDRRIFRTTGHSIATFPLVVMGRGGTANDEQVIDQSDRQPAIKRLREWWSVDDSDAIVPGGETGWSVPAGVALVA